MIKMMRARIADIPAEQAPSWVAVMALLRFENRADSKMHWTAEHPKDGNDFSVIDIEVPGEDVDGMRAEIEEAVGTVNDVIARDPTKSMTPADAGLAEVYLK